LDLSSNKLSTLPANSLLHLECLKILYIKNNQLSSLNLRDFPVSLLELYAENNVIKNLSFQNSSIRILNVQDNCISKICKNLTLLEKLKSFNINRNFLTDFPNIFLKSLETLDLSYNQLTLVPGSICTKNFPNLKILRINGKHLKDLKIRSELRLKEFEVSFAREIEKIEEETFLMLKERRNDCISVIVSNNIKLNVIHDNVFQHMNICFVSIL